MSDPLKDFATAVMSDESIHYMEIVTYSYRDGMAVRKTVTVQPCACKTHNHHVMCTSEQPIPQILGKRFP